jgi:hypothetical protein
MKTKWSACRLNELSQNTSRNAAFVTTDLKRFGGPSTRNQAVHVTLMRNS